MDMEVNRMADETRAEWKRLQEMQAEDELREELTLDLADEHVRRLEEVDEYMLDNSAFANTLVDHLAAAYQETWFFDHEDLS